MLATDFLPISTPTVTRTSTRIVTLGPTASNDKATNASASATNVLEPQSAGRGHSSSVEVGLGAGLGVPLGLGVIGGGLYFLRRRRRQQAVDGGEMRQYGLGERHLRDGNRNNRRNRDNRDGGRVEPRIRAAIEELTAQMALNREPPRAHVPGDRDRRERRGGRRGAEDAPPPYELGH